MKLSIIVPVYNVEQYIRPCVQSIFRQGLPEDDFEVIFVNDGTQDDSFDRIADVIAEHNNIVVLEQPNQGLSVARNSGLSKALGQYVLFLDSDDLLIDNTLPQLLALTNDMTIDLLIAGFVKLNNDEIDCLNQPPSNDYYTEMKSASEYFLKDFSPQHCYVWRTIYRKSFLDENKLRFIPGIYFEDVPFTTECLLKASNCIKTTLTFYIYRQRENSIVSSMNHKKICDFNVVLEKLWEMKSELTLSKAQSQQLMNTIFVTFSISVWYITQDKKLLLDRKTFVNDLKLRVPDLCFTNGLKQRLVSLVYNYCPQTYILLRSIWNYFY